MYELNANPFQFITGNNLKFFFNIVFSFFFLNVGPPKEDIFFSTPSKSYISFNVHMLQLQLIIIVCDRRSTMGIVKKPFGF